MLHQLDPPSLPPSLSPIGYFCVLRPQSASLFLSFPLFSQSYGVFWGVTSASPFLSVSAVCLFVCLFFVVISPNISANLFSFPFFPRRGGGRGGSGPLDFLSASDGVFLCMTLLSILFFLRCIVSSDPL